MKSVRIKYAKEGMTVIWIGFQDRKTRIREYAEKNAMGKNVGFDGSEKISKQYGIRYGAGLVVIDSDGIVRARLPKGFSAAKLGEAVDKALGTMENRR